MADVHEPIVFSKIQTVIQIRDPHPGGTKHARRPVGPGHFWPPESRRARIYLVAKEHRQATNGLAGHPSELQWPEESKI